MKLIVISTAIAVPNEHEIINSLFEAGMEKFQLHKLNFSKEETEKFIQRISSKHRNKISLHSAFPKFHSLKELEEGLPLTPSEGRGTYFFISPIFDSISKGGYKSNFDLQKIKQFLQKQKTPSEGGGWGEAVALGGIDEDKIEACRTIGFAGVAVLGAIWNSKNPIEKFKQIQSLCAKNILAT